MITLLNSTKHLINKDFTNSSKNRIEGTFFSSFYETRIILIAKTDNDITRKENHRLISFMKINVTILNEIPSN